VDEGAITEAVAELAQLLRADGGDLLLVEANPKTDRISLQLVLDDVSCADCILPPDMLFDTVQQSLQRRIRGEFELLLDDPRRP
jgi:hypothetical protein